MFFVSSDDGVTVSSLTVPDTPLVTDEDSESYGNLFLNNAEDKS